jgi:hypothetical protein
MAKSPENMDVVEKIGYSLSLWKESWEAFKLNAVTFIAIFVGPLVLLTIVMTFFLTPALLSASSASSFAINSSLVIALLVTLFVFLLMILLIPAMIATQLASAKGQVMSIENALKSGTKYILPLIGAGIVALGIVAGPMFISILLIPVVIGLLLLPIAIIWALVASFFLYIFPYLIIAEDKKPIESLKLSYEITKKKWHWVLALYAVSFLISLPSYIPAIGWLLSIVVTVIFLCLPAIVYVKHIAPKAASKK